MGGREDVKKGQKGGRGAGASLVCGRRMSAFDISLVLE